MQINISGISPEKKMYAYSAPAQVMEQAGYIGYLRGYFTDVDQFYSAWFDGGSKYNTVKFKQEFNDVVNSMRDNGGPEILKSIESMKKFCYKVPESAFKENYDLETGFLLKTIENTYFMRCNPRRHDYNVYIYAYNSEQLENHLNKSKSGIIFKTSSGKELCHLTDGERVVLTRKDGAQQSRICRYIDEKRLALGEEVYNTQYISDQIDKSECKIIPERLSAKENKSKQRHDSNIIER